MINATGVVSFSTCQDRILAYVKEVVENMANVIRLPGGLYNLGSETTKSIYEITEEFMGLIGKEGC